MGMELAAEHGALRAGARADGGASAASSAAWRLFLSSLGAAAVCGLLALSAETQRIPMLGASGTFLFVAILEDLRRRKIPNWLNGLALLGAVGHAAWLYGLPGLGTSLLGAATAFGLLFGAYLVGWLGAGDVKAAMVLGALWGVPLFLAGLFWMLLTGGTLALLLLTWRGGLDDLLGRWWMSFWITLTTRRPTYIAAAHDSTARSGLPFALCMGLGTVAYQFWGTPW